jgi:hypothetical protein
MASKGCHSGEDCDYGSFTARNSGGSTRPVSPIILPSMPILILCEPLSLLRWPRAEVNEHVSAIF